MAITLTTREKANRYDALQSAISTYIGIFRHREREAESQSAYDNMIGVYNKGQHDAYRSVLEVIERWEQ